MHTLMYLSKPILYRPLLAIYAPFVMHTHIHIHNGKGGLIHNVTQGLALRCDAYITSQHVHMHMRCVMTRVTTLDYN